MKTFFEKIIIFITPLVSLFLAGALFSIYDNLDKSLSDNHNIISLQTKSKYDSLDILFLGNSYCYSSINTHAFDSLNLKTFNLGIATAGTEFYELVINDYFNNVNSYPDKVLILITPITFSSKSDNFNAYPIHRYLENAKSNIEIAVKYNRCHEIISMYKKSIEKAFKSTLKSILTEKENKIRTNNKGYYPSEIIVDDKIIEKTEHLYTSLKEEHFPENKIKNLLRLAHIIEEKGSQVIFFELPTYKLNEYFNNDYLSKYRNGLDELSKKYKLINIDKSLFKRDNFRNIDHMNSSGAKIASKDLIRQLQ